MTDRVAEARRHGRRQTRLFVREVVYMADLIAQVLMRHEPNEPGVWRSP